MSKKKRRNKGKKQIISRHCSITVYFVPFYTFHDLVSVIFLQATLKLMVNVTVQLWFQCAVRADKRHTLVTVDSG